MTKLLAQYNDLGTFNGIGPLGEVIPGPGAGPIAALKLTNTISTIVGFITVMAGIWFMVQLIIGAFGWISAGGDKQHLDNSKKRVTNAIIGLFMVVVSFAFFAIIGAFFGLDVLNLTSAITNLAPQ
jgi:hypothetical protein